MDKGGQFQISFGMLFSIILIVCFIIVAFIALRAFFGVRCSVEQGIFINDLRGEIDRIYKGSSEDIVKEFKILGCDFEYVCFWDSERNERGQYINFLDDFKLNTGEEGDHNLYFYPRKEAKLASVFIERVNMTELRQNPECFKKEDDRVKIRLGKRIDEVLIRVS